MWMSRFPVSQCGLEPPYYDSNGSTLRWSDWKLCTLNADSTSTPVRPGNLSTLTATYDFGLDTEPQTFSGWLNDNATAIVACLLAIAILGIFALIVLAARNRRSNPPRNRQHR